MNKYKYISNAKEILKEHKYTLLANSEDCQVWKCSRENSNVYAFNIAVLPMGIAVVGDIGDYTFGVYGRHMSFLAGEDVEYYIHSKLTENCKKTEFDLDAVKSIIVDEIKEYIEENYEELHNQIKDLDFDEIKNYLHRFLKKSSVVDDIYKFFDDTIDKFEEVETLEDVRSAYDFFEHYETLNFSDVWEYEFEKTSEIVVLNLYIINEAAKQIIENMGE